MRSGILTKINFTLSSTTAQVSNATKLTSGGVINFTMYATDTSNNVKQNSTLITVADATAPIINGSLNKSISNILQNDVINASFNATDETGLHTGQVIINDTGANRYFNFTLSGATAQFSQNFTVSCAAGCVVNVTGRVNDTSNNLRQNETIFTVAYAKLNATVNAPPTDHTIEVLKGSTFDFNVTITCSGNLGSCGNVNVVARYNASGDVGPATNISTLLNETPFFILRSRRDQDIVVALFPVLNELRLYEYVNGAWRETNISNVPDQIEAIDIDDADNDGMNEIVAGLYSNSKIHLMVYDYNVSSGTWIQTNITNTTLHIEDLEIGDADNDGKNEIVIGLERITTTEPKDVARLRMYKFNDGVWNETNITGNDVTNSVQDVDIGDVDNDGLNEIVVLYSNVSSDENEASQVSMFKNSSLTWVRTDITELQRGLDIMGERLEIGDPDNDGRNEIVIAFHNNAGSNTVGRLVIIDNETGVWVQFNITNQTSYLVDGIDIGDANHDGRIDIAVITDDDSGGPSRARLYENTSGWKETNLTSSITGVGRDIDIGDATNDGLIDIIAAMNLNLSLFENISNIQKNTTINTFSVSIDSAQIGDPDNDERLNNLSCGIMNAGDNCQLNYTIKATGSVGTFWLIDVNATSTLLPSNDSTNVTIHIVSKLAPIINGSLNKSISNILQNDVINASFNATDETALHTGQMIINDTGANRYFNFTLSGATAQFSQNFTVSCAGCVVNVTGRVNDTSGNLKQNETIFTVSVADTTAPIVNATLNKSLQQIELNDIINITANATDETGLSTGQIIVNDTG
ncbi:hypothetical protein J4448_04135 [Candidatus Woesearchaeota archaeon]|nr:hypothetical protein [Candidatus Woesearchaeota archaeon]